MYVQLLTKNRLRANLLLAGILFALQGCTSAPWQKDFWSPPSASGEAPIEGQAYPIKRASGENLPQEWPNLADVPASTPNPLPQADAEQQLRQLESDRASATEAAARAAAANAATSSSPDLSVPTQAPSIPPEL